MIPEILEKGGGGGYAPVETVNPQSRQRASEKLFWLVPVYPLRQRFVDDLPLPTMF